MGKEKFKKGLEELDYKVTDGDGSWLFIKDYVITSGRFAGKILELAFEIPGSFEMDAPHGPHMLPCLFPVNTSTQDPKERMHKSTLGDEWGHLSRPFPNWEKDQRTVKRYMAYIEYLFSETL